MYVYLNVRWISLVILTVGVALAQLSSQSNAPAHLRENSMSGFVAVLLAACTSGTCLVKSCVLNIIHEKIYGFERLFWLIFQQHFRVCRSVL